MQAWGFANILFEPGEEFWQLVGQNAIWHIHDYSAQNIANGKMSHNLFTTDSGMETYMSLQVSAVS